MGDDSCRVPVAGPVASSAVQQRRGVEPHWDALAAADADGRSNGRRRRKRRRRPAKRRTAVAAAMLLAGLAVWSALLLVAFRRFDAGGPPRPVDSHAFNFKSQNDDDGTRPASKPPAPQATRKQALKPRQELELELEHEPGLELEQMQEQMQDSRQEPRQEPGPGHEREHAPGKAGKASPFSDGHPWEWIAPDVQAFLADEDASAHVRAPPSPKPRRKFQSGATPDAPLGSPLGSPLGPPLGSPLGSPSLTSLLRALEPRVNWVKTEGKSRSRAKEVVVLGAAGVIARDFGATAQAYSRLGLRVAKAADVSPAVKRGRAEANLRSVRNRDWGVVLCLALKTEQCLSAADFARLQSEQGASARVNRLAGLEEVLWSKDRFCGTAQATGDWQAVFTFPCWVLPRDAQPLAQQLRALRAQGRGRASAWIAKPFKQGGGKGIFVLDSAAEVEALLLGPRTGSSEELAGGPAGGPVGEPAGEPGRSGTGFGTGSGSGSGTKKYVLQPYLRRPHLLLQRKWDMRTYVLVTSAAPFARGFLFRDGLVRLAADVYEAGARHGGNRTQFLTNTSVNKRKNKSMEQLTWPFARLEAALGLDDFRLLFSRVRRAIGLMLVAAEKPFAARFDRVASSSSTGAASARGSSARGSSASVFSCANCFHVLGVDLIVDEQLFPRVIEVNGEPSMQLSGEENSHYDATKVAMQREAARIVLEPLPDLVGATLRDLDSISGAGGGGLVGAGGGFGAGGLGAEAEADEAAALYLLQLKREQAAAESFHLVYPDVGACEHPARARLWQAFLERTRPDDARRQRLHRLFTDFACQAHLA